MRLIAAAFAALLLTPGSAAAQRPHLDLDQTFVTAVVEPLIAHVRDAGGSMPIPDGHLELKRERGDEWLVMSFRVLPEEPGRPICKTTYRIHANRLWLDPFTCTPRPLRPDELVLYRDKSLLLAPVGLWSLLEWLDAQAKNAI